MPRALVPRLTPRGTWRLQGGGAAASSAEFVQRWKLWSGLSKNSTGCQSLGLSTAGSRRALNYHVACIGSTTNSDRHMEASRRWFCGELSGVCAEMETVVRMLEKTCMHEAQQTWVVRLLRLRRRALHAWRRARKGSELWLSTNKLFCGGGEGLDIWTMDITIWVFSTFLDAVYL